MPTTFIIQASVSLKGFRGFRCCQLVSTLVRLIELCFVCLSVYLCVNSPVLFSFDHMTTYNGISVLLFGSIMANCVYPYLVKCNIKVPTTTKFAIRSVLGSLAVA